MGWTSTRTASQLAVPAEADERALWVAVDDLLHGNHRAALAAHRELVRDLLPAFAADADADGLRSAR